MQIERSSTQTQHRRRRSGLRLYGDGVQLSQLKHEPRGGIAGAHYFAGRYVDAVKCARQALQSRYYVWASHRLLCASLAQAGQIEEAKAVLAQLRQLQPNLSIAWIRQSIPWTAGPMEKVLDGLRKAGLMK